jgi:hypothetical protein
VNRDFPPILSPTTEAIVIALGLTKEGSAARDLLFASKETLNEHQ